MPDCVSLPEDWRCTKPCMHRHQKPSRYLCDVPKSSKRSVVFYPLKLSCLNGRRRREIGFHSRSIAYLDFHRNLFATSLPMQRSRNSKDCSLGRPIALLVLSALTTPRFHRKNTLSRCSSTPRR